MTDSSTPSPTVNSSLPNSAANETGSSRREFLKHSATVATTASLLAGSGLSSSVHAGQTNVLKVGLVGCGGRGRGAALQALEANKDNRLFALADAFPGPMDSFANSLKKNEKLSTQVSLEPERQFVGLEAYKKLTDCCDVVLLCSPPGFRPTHLRYAVEAGKHIFTEKPMATDAPGVRSVIESVKIATEKKLAVVAGFCWRYDYPRRALFQRIHEGQIGKVQAIYGTYLTGPVQPHPGDAAKPADLTDLQWMVKNWYNWTWLAGDGLVEQAIHTVDWVAWAMQDQPPAKCVAVGGRQIPAKAGNIFDHVHVNYEWSTGELGFVAQRQIAGCHGENALTVIGSKGVGYISGKGVGITGSDPWHYTGENPNMYQVEHNEMFESIRKGEPINNGERMWKSTLMGIMGRMAAYTGAQVTWEKALNSKEQLVPEIKDWNTEFKPPGYALPGITRFE